MIYAEVIVKQRTQVETLTYALSAQIVPYIGVGSLVTVPLRQKTVTGVIVGFSRQVATKIKGKTKEITELAKNKAVFSAEQIEVIKRLASYYAAPLAEVAFHALDWPASSTSFNQPVAPFQPLFIAGPWAERIQTYQKIIAKTTGRVLIIFAQHNYADEFKSYISSSKKSPYVIYDIRRLSPKKQLAIVNNTELKIIIGTLAEIFFPLTADDTIIIDQPSHIGAKSQLRPFMASRQIGQIRAETERLKLVIGDTVPSVTDYLAISDKRLRLIKSAVADRPLVVIDRRRQKDLIAPTLLRHIQRAISSQEKVLVLVLARGNASALVCHNCGQTLICPSCQRTTAVFNDQLRCLYCGNEAVVPAVCPNCHEPTLKAVGEGVIVVKNELSRHLPDISIAELSSDQPAFSPVATITVATEKIFSFPGIQFGRVYVVSADRLLSGTELDGSWRLLSYLIELQNRLTLSGIEGSKQVIAQTFFPDSPVWSAAAGRTEPFFQAELINRRQLALPPFGAVIAVRGSANKNDQLFTQATKLTEKLLTILPTADISYPVIDGKSGSNYHGYFTIYLNKLPNSALKQKLASILPPAWHLDID